LREVKSHHEGKQQMQDAYEFLNELWYSHLQLFCSRGETTCEALSIFQEWLCSLLGIFERIRTTFLITTIIIIIKR
jgi:hypothetical protein